MRLLLYPLLLLLMLSQQLDAACNEAMSKFIRIYCSNPSASAFLCFKFRNCVASIKKAEWTPWKAVGVVDKENANCPIDEPAVIMTRSTNDIGVSESCKCYVRHEKETICKSVMRLKALNGVVGIGIGFPVENQQSIPAPPPFRSLSKNAQILMMSLPVVKQCEYYENETFDLAIIVDSSGSVGKKDFDLAKQSLKEIVRYLCNDYTECQIGPKLRLALIIYGRVAKVVFDFNRSAKHHRSNADVVRDIEEKMNYMSLHDGRTATGVALSTAEETVFDHNNGMRNESKKRILLLTDGRWNHGVNPIDVSERLNKTLKINIYAFGIGDNINLQELKNITLTRNEESYSNLYITLFSDFADFNNFAEFLNMTISPGQNCTTGEIVNRKRR